MGVDFIRVDLVGGHLQDTLAAPSTFSKTPTLSEKCEKMTSALHYHMHASIYVKSNIALNSVRYLEAVGISSR